MRFEVLKRKSIHLRLHYTGVARYTDVHQIGCMIALMIRIGRRLTGSTLKPTQVRIMHHIHHGKSELEKFLDADVEDGARVDEIELPAASWDLPIVIGRPLFAPPMRAERRRGARPAALEAESLEGAGGECDCGPPSPWAGAA